MLGLLEGASFWPITADGPGEPFSPFTFVLSRAGGPLLMALIDGDTDFLNKNLYYLVELSMIGSFCSWLYDLICSFNNTQILLFWTFALNVNKTIVCAK